MKPYKIGKAIYENYIIHRVKREYLRPSMEKFLANYTPKVNFYNCDRIIEHHVYANNNVEYELVLLGVALMEAIKSDCKFGDAEMSYEFLDEPQTEVPNSRIRMTIKIPVKEIE